MRTFWLWVAVFLGIGCGRYFAGAIRPMSEAQQGPHMTVQDDGTVSYSLNRLEISLRPVSDEELNRQFPSQSRAGVSSTNPYTYGNWRPMGDDWTPHRFTVFLLKVKNYVYPKMLVDPSKAVLVADNGRVYRSLGMAELSGYYRAYVLGQAGNFYARFEERKDILKRTLYRGDIIFSGQEQEGYLVFPPLHPDVDRFQVTLKGVVLRFDYKDEPLETTELTFRFQREVYKGYHPPPSLRKAFR
ncbi:MAG TPA: hypothetical protein EYP17_06815 [Candidatus Latescibacteria bacterium]|nr:hypothetical protein [Candidatus Latescibacterota bacterium]